MKIHTFRLAPGAKLKYEIQDYARRNKFNAGTILTLVGGLKKVSLRMAGATPSNQKIKELKQDTEIVSAEGTVESTDCHIHISVSDKNGQVIGGHLKEGIVAFTAEVVLLEIDDLKFLRKLDKKTGFEELVIEK